MIKKLLKIIEIATLPKEINRFREINHQKALRSGRVWLSRTGPVHRFK